MMRLTLKVISRVATWETARGAQGGGGELFPHALTATRTGSCSSALPDLTEAMQESRGHVAQLRLLLRGRFPLGSIAGHLGSVQVRGRVCQWAGMGVGIGRSFAVAALRGSWAPWRCRCCGATMAGWALIGPALRASGPQRVACLVIKHSRLH